MDSGDSAFGRGAKQRGRQVGSDPRVAKGEDQLRKAAEKGLVDV